MTSAPVNDHELIFLSIFSALEVWLLTSSQQVHHIFIIRSYVLNVCSRSKETMLTLKSNQILPAFSKIQPTGRIWHERETRS